VIEVGTNPSSLTTASADINGGTIDGTVIGGSSAAAGSFTTISASGEIAANGGVAFGDNDKATFGASDDLQIFHTGTESFIREVGEGGLKIDSNGPEITLRVNATENALVAESNGAVTLYYDNASKLATTSTGIDVTGTVTADGLTVETATGGVINLSSTDTALVDNDIIGQINFLGDDGSGAGAGTKGSITLASADAQGFTYDMSFNVSDVSTNNVRRMLLNYNGDISFYEDTGTTAKFFWDASAESLGIGTTSPSASTSLTAQASASSSLGGILMQDEAGANAGYIFVGGSAHSVPAYRGDLNLYSTNTLNFFTGGSTTQKAIIDSAGKVGIGTTSPAQALHVASTGSARIRLEDLDTVKASASALLEFSGTDGRAAYMGTDAGSFVTDLEAGSRILWRISGSEAARIDSSGNLLVGKTSAGINGEGFEATASGYIASVKDGGTAAYFQRKTSDGEIVNFRKDGTTVGSIGNNGVNLHIGSADVGISFGGGADAITPYNVGTGADRDAAIDLGTVTGTTRRFRNLYLSGGVYLGGTGAANHLDDYEEGTWSPHLYDSNDNLLEISFANQGSYIKIGKLVHLNFQCFGNGITSSFVGFPYMTLPFVAASATTNSAANVTYLNAMGSVATGYVSTTSTSKMVLSTSASNPLSNNATGAAISGSVRFYGSITYYTND
jgi:hypothetical protein